MKGEEILQKALQVFATGKNSYGTPEIFFRNVAKRWSLIIGREIAAADVIKCMIEFKMERLDFDPTHTDSIIDVAGYAACLAEVAP